RLEDGARFIGVAMHYIQATSSFEHLQAIHRTFHWDKTKMLGAAGHTPQRLDGTPEQAAAALRERLREMVGFIENTMDPLLTKAGMPLREVKRLTESETYPKEAVRSALLAKHQFPAEWETGTRECALAAARLCADALFTALSFAPNPFPDARPNTTGVNLVFNPSFEQPGDDIAKGWCIGWLDLNDKTGRAEWYRAGTHWDKPVKHGARSAMMLWAPEKGIEWRQTWRNALRVNPGEVYRASAWVKSRTEKGSSHLTLELSDTNYHTIAQPTSNAAEGKGDWTELKLETTIPPDVRWLRVMLHSNAYGAAWFDEVSVERITR
ncbi:MAG TPA: carbohydrate binding domain-containing protein, partial [Prosthecobacter sp.]|nr:carbohydrate binding domain-containing protein [Prosthecobacter sp.]